MKTNIAKMSSWMNLFGRKPKRRADIYPAAGAYDL
jgi:hypothetical protein